MSTHRHLTRRAAEQLLDGIADGSVTDGSPLAVLLAAAVPVAHPNSDLSGETAAVTALRVARWSTIPGRRPPLLTRMLTVKAAALVALVAAGGVALAAGVGAIPNPIGGIVPRTSHSTTASATHRASSGPATGTATTPSLRPTPSSVSASASGPASEPPSASTSGGPADTPVGLCNAWTNLSTKDRGKALQSPAFQALVQAAGGADNVPAYCAQVTASAHPSHPTHPSHGNPPNPQSSH